MNSKASVSWTAVVRVMGKDDDAMRIALSRYRAAGFVPDSFGTQRLARELLCDCLTAYEDIVEHRRGAEWAEWKSDVRGVREKLELELWP